MILEDRVSAESHQQRSQHQAEKSHPQDVPSQLKDEKSQPMDELSLDDKSQFILSGKDEL